MESVMVKIMIGIHKPSHNKQHADGACKHHHAYRYPQQQRSSFADAGVVHVLLNQDDANQTPRKKDRLRKHHARMHKSKRGQGIQRRGDGRQHSSRGV